MKSGPVRNSALASGKFAKSLSNLHCHRAYDQLLTSAADLLRSHAKSHCQLKKRQSYPVEELYSSAGRGHLKLSWAAEVSL